MKLFSWLKSNTPQLTAAQLERLRQLPTATPLGECSLREQRWIVVDLETTGLNLNRDLVISIGAVVIEDGAIDLGQSFERTLLRTEQTVNPSVLIHGLGPSALAAGSDPAEALLDFMAFVGDSPLLAFHAPFDQHMLSRALKDSLGYRLQHPFLDVADIAPLLCPQATLREAGLDDWIGHFNLHVEERHHASADALATAELALILFSRARQQQIHSPLNLQQRLSQWKRRQHSHSF
ncbi:3'-5' exonuclease [Pseudomonas gingeri]|uniref:3'-5' exonuclease n=1 Tax=Pseudomonas gingeri TaxID=117681 RepID=UPI00159F8C84|nr:3'-5' exonuclease [Pseudomonas gingeri]NWA01958.1 3'-5' exonuclease [Pseudomonas gingeri]NWA17966.1 3'-5' exonuclease [Pseudomonas gingeri]NWA53379.1 3'-5' exonuclease [Pseudomonas gingeri]NWA95308.1 3'-5' exonuclease [Pseudomonas gingeri]NWB00244.1 3'-5' exonuclease [Pseudomonas gingeri]